MAFEEITDDIEKLSPRGAGVIGMTAGAATLAGQVVKVTDSNEVSPSDTDGEETFGVVAQSVETGSEAAVCGPGTIAQVRASDATGPGFVTSNGATGEEGEVTGAGTGDYIIGILLDDLGAGDYGQMFVLPSGQVN